MSEQHLTTITYKSLNLPAELQQGIEESGFSYCTPIQAETLPIALNGRDVTGQAQTGTGKTAAFLVATVAHLLKHSVAAERQVNQPRAIILAPTRELAVQIYNDAIKICRHTGLKCVAVFGGTGYEQQRNDLEIGVDILIGTPGRIIDYFKQHVFNLKHIQVMVLDEADRMFDLGFIKDIRYLLRRMPPPTERLNLLFSATLSHRVNELAYEHMNNAIPVVIEAEKITASRIIETLYYPSMDEKIPLLLGLIQRNSNERTLVFVNTKVVADRVGAYLNGNDIKWGILSGDVPQKKRMHLLEEFVKGDIQVLVATDVAARGLHIPDVSLVINYDLPQDAEDYVHRIGRTARAGASGVAASFACEESVFSLPDIEQYIGYKIPMANIEQELLISPKPPVKIERPKKPFAKPRHKNDNRKPSRRHSKPPHAKSS